MKNWLVPSWVVNIQREDLRNKILDKIAYVKLLLKFKDVILDKFLNDPEIGNLVSRNMTNNSESNLSGTNSDLNLVIKKIYRKLAPHTHPDTGWNEELFKEVWKAKEEWDIDRLLMIANELEVDVGKEEMNTRTLEEHYWNLVRELFSFSILGLSLLDYSFILNDLNNDNLDEKWELMYSIMKVKIKAELETYFWKKFNT